METDIYLNRKYYTDESTIGELCLPGGIFECNTLEDTCRRDRNQDGILQEEEKIFGKTAIPAGRFEIKMEWSSRYRRNMPFLQRVPYFTGVMLHWGNNANDTHGCILVGAYDPMVKDFIKTSKATYEKLEPKLNEYLYRGRLFITINGGYRV